MRIDTLSTFPHMYDSVMGESIMKRAQASGALDFHAHDLRDWTHDRHRTTDDDPYGGGQGLVMKCEPIFEAYDDIVAQGSAPYTIFLTPCGEPFDQGVATELSEKDRCCLFAGITRALTSAPTRLPISAFRWAITCSRRESLRPW